MRGQLLALYFTFKKTYSMKEMPNFFILLCFSFNTDRLMLPNHDIRDQRVANRNHQIMHVEKGSSHCYFSIARALLNTPVGR